MRTEPAALTPSRHERTLATVAHALSFIEGGILGPLLLYALRKEAHKLVASSDPEGDSAFVAFHSLQSTYFGLLFAAVGIPVALVTCGWGLALLAPVYIVFEIIACVKANEGEWYVLPVVGGWALRSHPRQTPAVGSAAAAGEASGSLGPEAGASAAPDASATAAPDDPETQV